MRVAWRRSTHSWLSSTHDRPARGSSGPKLEHADAEEAEAAQGDRKPAFLHPALAGAHRFLLRFLAGAHRRQACGRAVATGPRHAKKAMQVFRYRAHGRKTPRPRQPKFATGSDIMVHAIRIHQTGGPEVMKWESVEVGAPGPGQVRLKQHGVGVNYIDVYQRSGLYKMPTPFVAGSEGSGEVVAVGPGVTDFKVGDRGAYAGAPGGYAEERVMPADRLVKLPDSIDYKTGAAMMLQGMTVRYLLRQTYKVGSKTTMLLSCGGRRRRSHRLSVGAPPRRHRHRHRQHAG